MAITVFRAIIIYIAVVAAVRILGKRQIGELKPHEFVITILISAVATVPLEENSIPLTNSILPILIFVSLEIIESLLAMKFRPFRDILQGKPIFIIKDGKLMQKEMKRMRLTVYDIIDSLRQKDVFDISNVENAVVETNGSLSVQLKDDKEGGGIPVIIAADGEKVKEYFGDNIIKESEIDLALSAIDEKLENIMLLTIDKSGKLYLVRKDKK